MQRRRPRRTWSVERLEPRQVLAAQPIISEFMAENNRALDDGDGNSSDWIEIYNAGDAAVDLAGYHLTDNAADLDRWTFPSTMLEVGEYKVVFASGMGAPDSQGNLHTNFSLERDGEYLALVAPGGAILSQFNGPSFPNQREDISYGVAQSVTTTKLIEAGNAAKFLVPTPADSAAIGSTWTGGTEHFSDTTWQNVQLGLGYEGNQIETELRLANVARNKTAAQSTSGFGYTAAPATDGSRGNLTHTATGDLTPWLEVDLGGDYFIESIRVFNRGDNCCQERHYNLRVEVRDAANAVIFTSAVFNPWNGSNPAAPPQPSANLFDVDLTGQPGGGITGRHVRVTKGAFAGSEWLSIGEVEIDAMVEVPIEGDNAALGSPVTPSGPLYPGFTNPNILTDGNRATFSHPATEVASFHWTIDLGQSRLIDRINVVNRGDGCCPDRLTNYRVTVHTDDDGEFGPSVWTANVRTNNTNSGAGGVDVLTSDLDPAGEFEGRWIRIERNNTGAIGYWPQIAEVEVFPPVSYDPIIASDIESSMKFINASAYVRVPFNVPDPSVYNGLTLRMRSDDGFVAYLNGVEVARQNAPNGVPAYNATANAKHFSDDFIEFSAPVGLLDAGVNILAIHGLNITADDDDFLVLAELVARTITQDAVGYLPDPTPRSVNGQSVEDFVADTMFDVDRGFFENPFDVNLATSTPGATLVYTTDGSPPTLSHGTQVPPPDANTPPTATIHVATTTTLRAAAFKSNFQPTNVDTQTYLFLGDVIHQPANPPGVPATWSGGFAADYQMDPDVVNNLAYSDEIIEGLKSIPTMSLVFEPDDLWSATDGIYYYPERLGIEYERPVSIEVINPDGTTMFQEDGGARIWGTGWRPHSSTPKHSLQLKFKDIYGDTKLRHPLFPDAPVDAFDDLILRAQGSRSWLDFRTGTLERDATQYIHDSWARDTARDMGKHDGHATFVHLYLNGLYWGIYNPVERPTGNFGEEYFGGENDDYDVLSHRVGEPVVANEGDLVAWNQLMTLLDTAPGPSSSAVYAQIQQLVDVDNLIDYMLINQYATNHDGPSNISGFAGNNMRLLRKREPGGQFRFYHWDMEYTFWNPTENSNINDVDAAQTIGHIYQKLRENLEFRQQFADRAVMHLTGDGALTPAKAAARWQARADEIYTAIIGESARWGDYRRPTQPYTRDVEWAAELNRLKTQYFPQRTNVLIGQLKAADLFPDTPAPEFNQDGGVVAPGFNLEMSVMAPPVLVPVTVLTQGSPVQALVPTSGDLGQTWTQVGFTPTGWLSGSSGVGYDTAPAGANYNPVIGVNVAAVPPATNHPVSVYTRFPFDLGAVSPADVVALRLRMKYDDGFVAYLNETEVLRCYAPGSAATCTFASGPTTPPAYSDAAAGPFRSDLASVVFVDFDLTAFKNLLVTGPNMLAIHGMNAGATSNDFLVLPELIASTSAGGPPIYYTLDGSDPRMPGGAISSTAIQYQVPITINTSTPVAARTLNGSEWSGLSSVQFTVQLPLRITEVMYHPANQTFEELARTPGGAVFYDDDDYEFIEVLNIGALPVDLSGVSFTGGIEFTLATQSLVPGEYGVVVRHQAAFENRYGNGRRILGVYGGTPEDFGLQNSGEQIVLVDAGSGAIHDFTYDDAGSWPAAADGDGASLVIIDPAGSLSNWTDPVRWRASFDLNGSPAGQDRMPGDVNEDFRVDAADLAIVQTNFGTAAGAARGDGDLDGDTAITRGDVRLIALNFGRSFPPPTPPAPSAPRAVVATRLDRQAVDTALPTLRITASRRRPIEVQRTIEQPAANSPQPLTAARKTRQRSDQIL